MSERTDRELLELAARAAGVKIVPCTCRYEEWPFKYADGQGRRGHWNPLVNDGDALRLAVRLNMTLTVMKAFCGAKPNFGGNGIDLPTLGEDKGTVLCRAIVMAAAEIGANMQS